jgi:hypothetical protein
VAASFSYLHALDVVGEHSRPSIMNNGFPLTVDGLIFAGSMVLLNDARRGLAAHPLAWFALGLGIAATLTVNVVSGLGLRRGRRSRLGLAGRGASAFVRTPDDHRPPVSATQDRECTRGEDSHTRAASRTERSR